ncbi:hypothetical protein BDZ89DRAFT_1075020, partial [Hymenopellis radicata]
MFYSKFLQPLCILVLAALVPTQAAVPTLTKLFDGTLFIDPTARTTNGPFGTRTLIGFTGGNLTDPNGHVLASVLPGLGGELGLLGSNNVFYPNVRLGLQWLDDSSFAYVELHGSGEFLVAATSYARFETDSSSRADLNGRFTILKIDLVNLSPATFEIFAL